MFMTFELWGEGVDGNLKVSSTFHYSGVAETFRTPPLKTNVVIHYVWGKHKFFWSNLPLYFWCYGRTGVSPALLRQARMPVLIGLC